MYEIIDSEGIVHYSGSEYEMIQIFENTKENQYNNNLKDFEYIENWSGDLKLIKVIDIFR